jgi:hypothetical protein
VTSIQQVGLALKLSVNSSPKAAGEASPPLSSRSIYFEDLLSPPIKENERISPGIKQRAIIPRLLIVLRK